MPLDHGYGVVIGALHHYYRDPLNDYGQYFHGNVEVKTSAGIYKCAVDVDSKSQPNGVQWRVVVLGKSGLAGVAALADGWHNLVSDSASGALDYLHSRELKRSRGSCRGIFDPLSQALCRAFDERAKPVWKSGTSIQALSDLEPLINNSQRLFIFGEPFTTGLGVHNIHQNQGDPPGSQWWDENGIWQDGATLIQRPNGSIAAFLNKFKTQASHTDSAGHPA